MSILAENLSTQPRYYENAGKFDARRQLMAVYSSITRSSSIPFGRSYWTLCNRQPNVPGSEINQMVDAGFLTKNQYHGIDRHGGMIKQNRADHPRAKWFEGDWLHVIRKHHEIFTPALVHFDSTLTIASREFVRILADTMNLCREAGTVVAATASLANAYTGRKFDPSQLPLEVDHFLDDPNQWGFFPRCHSYVSGKTKMGIYIFRRQ